MTKISIHPIQLFSCWCFMGDYFFLLLFPHICCLCNAASLPTCRPAESQRLSDILAHRMDLLLLHLSHPSRHAFPLHQRWHHHGGTQGPPHLLPITASQTPPRKTLQTTWDLKETNWCQDSPPVGLTRCGCVRGLPVTFCFKLRDHWDSQDYHGCECGGVRCSDTESKT